MIACLAEMQEKPGFNSWVRKIPWRREWLPTPEFLLGKSHGQRAWQAIVHTQLQFLLFKKNFSLPFSFLSEFILHYK